VYQRPRELFDEKTRGRKSRVRVPLNKKEKTTGVFHNISASLTPLKVNFHIADEMLKFFGWSGDNFLQVFGV
jgi:hypothetical protein